MLLIACTLALLVIVAGMKLMAQTQKDNLGNLYKYVSWFVVVMGFLCLLCVGMHCAMRCCHKHERMNRHCEMYMHEGCDGGMMNCNRGMMGGCMMHQGCDEMMGNSNCNMSGSCNNMGNCKEDMGSCNMGDGGTCPMMKDGKHCEEKDSVVIIKKDSKK